MAPCTVPRILEGMITLPDTDRYVCCSRGEDAMQQLPQQLAISGIVIA